MAANTRVRQLVNKMVNWRASKPKPSQPYVFLFKVKINNTVTGPDSAGIYFTIFKCFHRRNLMYVLMKSTIRLSKKARTNDNLIPTDLLYTT